MDFLKRMTLSGLNGIQRTLNEIKTKVESCDLSRVEREFENFNRHWENVVRKFKENSQRYVVRIPYDADTQIIKSETNGNHFTVRVQNDETFTGNTESTYSFRHESTIPSHLVNGVITQKYSPSKKQMLFIFQSPVESENVGNVDELIDSINATVEEGEANDVQEEVNTTLDDATALVVDEINLEGGVDTTATTLTMEDVAVPSEDEVNARIWELYTQGKSYRYIASQVGVSDKTVARRIKKMIG
jgi:predicted transcriptional regulator